MSLWRVDTQIVAEASAAQRQLLDPVRHVWVSAHAGTGKTETLTRRVAALLLADPLLSPRDVLCLTYTRAAASEMHVRLPAKVAAWVKLPEGERDALLVDLLGRAAKDTDRARLADLPRVLREAPLWVTTIHGLCGDILSRFPREAGVRPGFAVLTEPAQERLLEDAQRRVLGAPDEGVTAALDVLVGQLGDHAVRTLVKLVRDQWHRLLNVMEAAHAAGGVEAYLAGAADGMTEEVALVLTADDEDVLRRWMAALAQGGKNDAKLLVKVDAALAAREDWDLWEAVWWNKEGEFKQLGLTNAVKDLLAGGLGEQVAAVRAKVLLWRTHNRTAEGYALTRALLVWVARVRQAYDEAKATANVLDYHDLIVKTAALVAGWDTTDRAWVMEQLDREIKHLLLDEGQDNSHVQNEIVRALAAELVRAGGTRTLLAVGDVKQSIYRFQGAAPARFMGLRDWLQQEAAEGLVVGQLAHSFRSSAPVLQVADAVWRETGGEEIHHASVRPEAAGWVVRRPLVISPRAERNDEQRWLLAEERQRLGGRAVALGAALADEIEGLVGRRLASTGERARYCDVMVLVKTKDVGAQLAGVMEARGIPVRLGWSGARLPLLVRDVLALAGVLVAPGNRALLGQVLVSPLVGWSQERVAGWLSGAALGDEVEAWLAGQRGVLLRDGVLAWLVGLESPALLARWCGDLGGSVALAQAWWRALLGSAVVAEGVHAWIETVRSEGLPGMVAPVEDAVQVCTVHGAKGLEAPVVMLPETTFELGKMHRDDKLVWDEGATGPVGVWFYRSGKVGEPVYQQRLREAEERAVGKDQQRMLYVAVTRAQEGLVVLGAHTGNEDKREDYENSANWYGQVGRAMRAAGGEMANGVLRVGDGGRGEVIGGHEDVADEVDVPAWVGGMREAVAVVDEGDAAARAFGVQVHAALQGDWRVVDAQALAEAAAVRAALPEVFTDGVMEVDVLVEGKLKRVDRLVMRGDEVWVVDFKTDRVAAEDVTGVRPAYVAQVAGYVAALQAGFGKAKKVRGAVIYTAKPTLLWVA